MRSAPGGKLGFYGGDHLLEDRKVAVVQTTPPGQLPASLKRIQRGTVRRQVVPLKAGRLRISLVSSLIFQTLGLPPISQ